MPNGTKRCKFPKTRARNADKFFVMTTTELTIRLNTAYSLLKDTVESDICSAYNLEERDRPILPTYLDGIYISLVHAVEIERDVEAGLITLGGID